MWHVVTTTTPSCCLDTSPTLRARLLLLCLVDGVCVQGAPLRPAALAGVGVLMLQREVPEAVNLAAAQAAAAAGIHVMLVSCRCSWLGPQSGGSGNRVGTRAGHIFSQPDKIDPHAAVLCCGVLCCQDAGGTDRPLPPALLPLLTYLCPNELELQALSGGSATGTHKEVRRVDQTLLLLHVPPAPT